MISGLLRGRKPVNDGPHGLVSRGSLEGQGFLHSWSVTPEFSLAGFVERPGRCGIYLLAFDDGDWYVGQAIDVVRRFLDHRKRFASIARVYLKTVPPEGLDEEELRLVRLLEDEWGWRCRNIRLSSRPKGPSGLFELINMADLSKWTSDPRRDLGIGEPREFEELSRKLIERQEAMDHHPLAADVRALASRYVRTLLPLPRLTEYHYWCLACHATEDSELLLRVSLWWQEVFALFAVGDELEATFQVVESRLPEKGISSTMFRLGHRSVTVYPHAYEPGGSDQVQLVASGTRAIERLMADPHFIRAAREMNGRLMRKGTVNPGFSSSHCAGWVGSLALENY